MALANYLPTYHNLSVTARGLGEFHINYVEAGSPYLPTVVLLHGFPSSSTQYRDLIPMLSSDYHVLAPDMPGFGLTVSPPELEYSFDNLAAAMEAWIAALNVTSYAMYIFDYGAPVGLRMAARNSGGVKAIVTQNGNAYDDGFGRAFWAPIMELWATNSTHWREYVREHVLTLEATRAQYIDGTTPGLEPLVDPVTWNGDYLFNLAGPAKQEIQIDLFYDYRTNKAMYPAFQQYFRQSQVPLLAVWGRNDQAFIPAGAEAFKKDLPNAEVRFVDAGHFALETRRWEIARMMLSFLARVGF